MIAEPLYRLLKTPEDIFNDAVIYISIYFLGSVGSMLYSANSCILRAVGDSKTPFWGVAISSVLNIVLDLVAVYIPHWGVGGAAIATVISITVAGIYCLIKVKQIPLLKSENKETGVINKV